MRIGIMKFPTDIWLAISYKAKHAAEKASAVSQSGGLVYHTMQEIAACMGIKGDSIFESEVWTYISWVGRRK